MMLKKRPRAHFPKVDTFKEADMEAKQLMEHMA